jgi:hypothetical protein
VVEDISHEGFRILLREEGVTFQRLKTWKGSTDVEIAYTPTNSSRLNRIEARFTALRHFALGGTDHRTHQEQGGMIRRYIAWRNRNAEDRELRCIVERANSA